jgi:hypothetical protein
MSADRLPHEKGFHVSWDQIFFPWDMALQYVQPMRGAD